MNKLILTIGLTFVFCLQTAGTQAITSSSNKGGSRNTAAKSGGSKSPHTATTKQGADTAKERNAKRKSLSATGKKPSSALQKIIYERENTGPGWLGTAFLISLFSQHNLSVSDKQWILSQVNTYAMDGDEEALVALESLRPVIYAPNHVDGEEGEPLRFTVNAKSSHDNQINVRAEDIPPGSTFNDGVFFWEKPVPGYFTAKFIAGSELISSHSVHGDIINQVQARLDYGIDRIAGIFGEEIERHNSLSGVFSIAFTLVSILLALVFLNRITRIALKKR